MPSRVKFSAYLNRGLGPLPYQRTDITARQNDPQIYQMTQTFPYHLRDLSNLRIQLGRSKKLNPDWTALKPLQNQPLAGNLIVVAALATSPLADLQR